VQAIRALPDLDGTDVAVTGATAISIDISDKLGGALAPYLALIVGLAYLLLMLVFRSVLVPLKATLSGFILSGQALIRELGFGLALAVAIDVFVVRMTVVPAVMALLGRRAWYLPRWLDRLLPNVDVEGDSLVAPRQGVMTSV
jgi:uncharacterized membrane protein YdfJ with MMPL/SSD domain